MAQSTAELIQRLGPDGLARALNDLMDKPRLARLATACNLKYPGVRIRSVKRDRLLTDLIARAKNEESVREAIRRALDKETRAERSKWDALSSEEKARRLDEEDNGRVHGNVGRHMWILASTDDGGADGSAGVAREHLERLVQGSSLKTKEPAASRAELRLKRRLSELEKKAQHAETQMIRSRDSEKRVRADMIQRKGELAESRMLAERMRRELDDTKQALERARTARSALPDTAEMIGPVERAIKRLATGQRKLVHAVEKLNAPRSAAAGPSSKAVEALFEGIQALHKELAALRREDKRETDGLTQRLDELAAAAEKPNAKPATRKERRPRVKEAEKRVGVFIDVQNVYYGARKLKGLLDFDALMQAAVAGRRLIHSTAYVVESKEIDQSWFIARLQQKAIEVRRKPLRVRADGSTKGDWDMELALDILDAAAGLDVVILVSGDGDFTSLVKRVKRIGPRVEVIAFPRHTAKSLIEAADRFQPLDRKFMIYKRPAGGETEGDPAPAETGEGKA